MPVHAPLNKAKKPHGNKLFKTILFNNDDFIHALFNRPDVHPSCKYVKV